MKTIYAAALGAALILPGAAMAQSTTTTPGATAEPPASSSGTMTSPGAGQSGAMTSPDTSASGSSLSTTGQTAAMGAAGEGHEVIGKKLQNAEGEELGEISNLLVDQQGQVAKLVVDAEGGEKVELDWQRVTMNQDGEIQSTMKKDEVAELPKYEEKSN